MLSPSLSIPTFLTVIARCRKKSVTIVLIINRCLDTNDFGLQVNSGLHSVTAKENTLPISLKVRFAVGRINSSRLSATTLDGSEKKCTFVSDGSVNFVSTAALHINDNKVWGQGRGVVFPRQPHKIEEQFK